MSLNRSRDCRRAMLIHRLRMLPDRICKFGDRRRMRSDRRRLFLVAARRRSLPAPSAPSILETRASNPCIIDIIAVVTLLPNNVPSTKPPAATIRYPAIFA